MYCCREYGRLCELANERGFCQITGCTRTDLKTELASDTREAAEKKRACINCGRRDLWGAGSRCGYDGHYIGYLNTWGDWCRHWCKDKRPLGEIGVYSDD